jgi:hypothetical protein
MYNKCADIYCSVYGCCYSTIARRNMRCFVTTGKHVNDIRAIARQLLCKRVPAATNTHVTVEKLLDYNNGKGCFLCVSCRNVISRVSRVAKFIVVRQYCTGGCEEKTLCAL